MQKGNNSIYVYGSVIYVHRIRDCISSIKFRTEEVDGVGHKLDTGVRSDCQTKTVLGRVMFFRDRMSLYIYPHAYRLPISHYSERIWLVIIVVDRY